MSRLECKCGAEMSTVNSPSPNVINIFLDSDIEKALSKNPSISLWDFYTQFGLHGFDFWYCPDCKRITVTEYAPDGKVVAIYTHREIDCSPNDIDQLKECQQIFLFNAIEIDLLTELDFTITLKQYLQKPFDTTYYLSPDKKTIYAMNTDSGTLAFVYCQESLVVQ